MMHYTLYICIILLSHGHLGVAYYLVVERVARLHTVNHLAFLVVAHARNHSDGLVEVYVEILVLGVDLLHSDALEGLHELFKYQLHALLDGLRVVGGVGHGALHVVEDGQNGRGGLLAAVE